MGLPIKFVCIMNLRQICNSTNDNWWPNKENADLARAAKSSSSFLANWARSSAIWACSSAIWSWISVKSPSSLRLFFSSSWRCFSSLRRRSDENVINSDYRSRTICWKFEASNDNTLSHLCDLMPHSLFSSYPPGLWSWPHVWSLVSEGSWISPPPLPGWWWTQRSVPPATSSPMFRTWITSLYLQGK